MMASGLLLLLVCAGAVLSSAEAQDPYNGLSDNYRKGVDLALEQLRSHAGVHHHFRFWKSVDKSDIESGFGARNIFHHFHLKPTWCNKDATNSNPQNCPFRNDRPLMDCTVCYKVANGEIEARPKPYVHCIQRPRLTAEMRTSRTENCKKISYSIGAPTLLAVSASQN